ncbi:hypothetical protein SAMN04487943_106262 [Gracilibacillus orientalis]|uniref:Uncharacterized protein n=1 Tax=Gracilibacillus orientalis TaxID=334253 RepID=A0A1I4MH90_9BACI|nr:hypothetical protein [Gracilibacillus orientalis]SFM02608.1 hypothetical protein SAMN04487943_106262 [Gracilibacillus orientalis]
MRLKIYILVSIILLITTLFISASSSSIENPNARDILRNNPDADIIQLDGLIYQNVTNREWIETDYQMGEQLGEIKKRTDRKWFYRDFFATTLAKGTILYTEKDSNYQKGDFPFTVLVEEDDDILVYQALVEG